MTRPHLDVLLQTGADADRVLLDVVDDGAVGDVVLVPASPPAPTPSSSSLSSSSLSSSLSSSSSSLSPPAAEEEDQDDDEGDEGGAADEGEDGGDVALEIGGETRGTWHVALGTCPV